MIIQVRGKKIKAPEHRNVTLKQLELIASGKEPCFVLLKRLPKINKPEQELLNKLVSEMLVIPDAFTDKWIKEPELLKWAANLNINVFEGVRLEIERRGENTALAIPYIFQALKLPRRLRKYHYEVGLKVYSAIGIFLSHWEQYGVYEKPSEQEEDAMEEAGVHLIQSFNAYPMIQSIAERYGKLPQEIEQQTAGWVYKDFVFNKVRSEYQKKYSKIMERKQK